MLLWDFFGWWAKMGSKHWFDKGRSRWIEYFGDSDHWRKKTCSLQFHCLAIPDLQPLRTYLEPPVDHLDQRWANSLVSSSWWMESICCLTTINWKMKQNKVTTKSMSLKASRCLDSLEHWKHGGNRALWWLTVEYDSFKFEGPDYKILTGRCFPIPGLKRVNLDYFQFVPFAF